MVPTIKVLVTFTKFEEIEPVDEFKTPLSSPTSSGYESPAAATTDFTNSSSSSSWFRRSRSNKDGGSSKSKTLQETTTYLDRKCSRGKFCGKKFSKTTNRLNFVCKYVK